MFLITDNLYNFVKNSMVMAYKALDIARKLIYKAQNDEPNGGDRMTNLKLQKLLYYQQGYHLAFFDTPLFDDKIEAWMYGPVVPSVYDVYAKYVASTLPEINEQIQLADEEEELFNEVYDAYREFSAIGLMNRTHSEAPWRNATLHDIGAVITQDSMKSYFLTKIR
nr:MAG TPA_asm: hypothetical protein [Caudoviricetes sp.]